MESTYYIFPIPEIEHIIVSYLDPLFDYQKLISVNKYFYEIIENDKVYIELKNFCKQESTLKLIVKIENKIQEYFTQACKYGFLYVVKYLLDRYPNKINIHENNEYAFRLSYERGHLEVSQWLYELDHKFDIHDENEWAFRWSCANGRLEVAKWLYGLNYKIDIHVHSEWAFQYSCRNGYLEVAKWLYGLDNKIDIHADNELAFQWSCRHGHLEVAQWLASLTDKYELQIEDHKIVKWKVIDTVAKN